jgi:ubiquinone biosynthesis protein
LYLPGNRIALIDFGMVGRLSPVRRNQVVELLAGLARHDESAMLEVLLDWRGDDAVDEPQLAADLSEFAFDYADVALKDLKIGMLLHRVSAILREHAIVLPADLTLLFKALITLEGLGRQYDPEFRLVERIKPFLDRALSSSLAISGGSGGRSALRSRSGRRAKLVGPRQEPPPCLPYRPVSPR